MSLRRHGDLGSSTLPRTKRRLSGTWSSFSTILRKHRMCEGKRSQVVLLDERRLELLIQPKLYAGELLDIVASHFHLKEKEYFGISYLNDTGQHSWLQLDKRILDHDLPKKGSSNAPALTFYFRVKYFVESITQLKDSATVEAFYLQAKSLLAKGDLEADSETVFQLAALVLQATYGDYVDESMFRSHLRRLPILPTSTLKEFPSITHCEEKVLKHYKGIVGQSRGDAIVNYLTLVESLPTYGQHYYEVKDKTGSQCHLGLSYRGISQYDKSDRRSPTRVFLWKQLENLYFRDKKFTIEVHEVRRVVHTLSSFNLYEDAIEEPIEEYDDLSDAICDPTTQVSVSRRTLAPANVTVYVWYAISPLVTKCIWSMAIAQHHFFLDRRHQKIQVKLAPCLSQIASELCRSVQSLSSLGSQSNISRSTSSSSLPSTILGGELSEESKAATIEMLAALHARKEALEEALKKKTEELKSLCVKEGELTGEIPPEMPLQPGEARPQVRRRVGTSFSLSDRWMCKTRNKEKELLNDLELEYEIQSKIASAAFQLANDCTARKSVRKQRKMSYAQATAKLRILELKLQTLQRERKEKLEREENDGSECSVSSSEKATIAGSRMNLSDSLSSHSDSRTLLSSTHSTASVPPCSSLPQLTVTASPESPGGCRQRHQSLQHVPFSGSRSECQAPRGWTVTSSYCPDLEFDTVSCASSASVLPLKTPYRNRFESRLDIEGSNLYSVPNRRASQVFDSQDDLLLSARKSDYEKRSPSASIPLGHVQYSDGVPLSASYDERLWCRVKSKELTAISSESSSLETSFDGHSNNSCDNYYDSTCREQTTVEMPSNPLKLHHFYSENSLHRDEIVDGNTHPADDDIRPMRKITHVYSVPHLHEEIPSHEQLPKSNFCGASASHSLNQVVDLVNASMLRQGGKKSAMSAHSRSCLSPKAKTKEWIETSLDSPIPVRKSKSRSVCDSNTATRENAQESVYDNHVISLSPYPQDRLPNDVFSTKCQDYATKQQSSNARAMPVYGNISDNRWSSNETVQSCFSPSETEKKPTFNFQETSTDSVPSAAEVDSDQQHFYSEYRRSESQNLINDKISAFNSNLPSPYFQNARFDADVHQTPPYSDFVYPSRPPIVGHPPISDQTVPRATNVLNDNEKDNFNLPLQHSRTSSSSLQVLPLVEPQTHNISCDSLDEVNLNDTVQYNEATIVDIPQEMLDPLPLCNGSNFPYAGNVEVNVVSVGHFQPYWEETKPYELSDFYKYSTKHRKSQAESVVDDVDAQPWTKKDGRTSVESPVFQNGCNSLLQSSLSPSPHNEILMNAHIAVMGHADYNGLYEKEGNRTIVTSPLSGDANNSFGEVGIRVSVADTFHDEMLAWYENRDSAKKATLV